MQEVDDEVLHGSASGQTGGVVALLAGKPVVPELALLPQKVGTPHKMLPTVDKSSTPLSPEPEVVGSNPALPEGNPISHKQLLVELFFLAVVGILVHCAINGLRLSCSERQESG